jgi:hypothetical protein
MYAQKFSTISATGPSDTASSNVAFNTIQMSPEAFASKCGQAPKQEFVSVPVVNHISHVQDIRYETVSQEVKYTQVPIVHTFEQRIYAPKNQMMCPIEAKPVQAPVAVVKPACGC